MGVLEGHFFLADILSENNKSIFDKLHVVLQGDRYFVDQNLEDSNIFNSANIVFKDSMKAHNAFWSKYKRPPRTEFWDYFIERVDLLTPQDVRERKGSYFTPQIWVEKSQEYLADVLGEDWQDEYYIWDCCAGTGNMEAGLTNKYRVWASTLDVADVKIMHERIEKGANLLPAHCFQFDFLNDDLQDPKVPEDLRKILADEERRKKLIVYINPPYAEIAGKKTGVNLNKTHDLYKDKLSDANRELYAQFLIRIFIEIHGCYIGEFSKMKIISGSNFSDFRKHFKSDIMNCFVVPADTFDNVKGKFPIGFKVWKTHEGAGIKDFMADVYDSKGNPLGKKGFYTYSNSKYFSVWINSIKDTNSKNRIGWFEGCTRNDFSSKNGIYFQNLKEQTAVPRGIYITVDNFSTCIVALAVRHCIEATWLNDRDQFLYPNDGWKYDKEFQNDCLAYTLFHGQNRIMSKHGTNHWIPFTEEEVGAKMAFDSHFMSDFIRGKHKSSAVQDLFGDAPAAPEPIVFSAEAQAVMDAGRELWRYYHSQYGANPNASFYDIRAHFQGVDDKGRMNPDSDDPCYTELIQDLRQKQRILAKKIEIGVYKYGFLYNGAPQEDEPEDSKEEQETISAPETNLKDIVKHHKSSSKKIVNYNITVQGDLKVGQMIGKQQK